jgi:hypothetical protein
MQESVEKNKLVTPDVIEDDIRTQMPHILEILLLDRTTSSPKSSKTLFGRMTTIKNTMRFPMLRRLRYDLNLSPARGAN